MLFFSYRTAQFFAPSSYYLPNLLQLFKHFLRQETKHSSVFTLTFLSQKHLIVLLLFIRFLLVSILNHFAQLQSLQELYEFYSDGVCIKCNN